MKTTTSALFLKPYGQIFSLGSFFLSFLASPSFADTAKADALLEQHRKHSYLESCCERVRVIDERLDVVELELRHLTNAVEKLEYNLARLMVGDTSPTSNTSNIASMNQVLNSGTLSILADNSSLDDQGDRVILDVEAYKACQKAIQQGDYTKALQHLDNFLAAYPGSLLAPNALYWAGEMASNMGQMGKAADYYAKVYKNYPQNPKSPDALYKLALVLEKSGNIASAITTLTTLQEQYPNLDTAFQQVVANTKQGFVNKLAASSTTPSGKDASATTFTTTTTSTAPADENDSAASKITTRVSLDPESTTVENPTDET